MLAQNQGMLQTIWTIFVTWKNWFKTQTVFFQTGFSKTSLNTKTRYLNNFLKHSVYGYDPPDKHGEISMFLTLCTKHDLYSL